MSATEIKKVNAILDDLERSREERYTKGKAGRKGMLHQGYGFRTEWSRYLIEYNDNLYNS